MSHTKKWMIRIFLLLFVMVVGLDTTPSSVPPLGYIRFRLSQVLYRFGFWQNEWTLFAPDPYLDNSWYTAELIDATGQQKNWGSESWEETSMWARFRSFRHINYFSRLGNRGNASTVPDFVNHLTRSVESLSLSDPPIPFLDGETRPIPGRFQPPVTSVKLYRNSKRMMLDGENPMPKREETYWKTESQLLFENRYEP